MIGAQKVLRVLSEGEPLCFKELARLTGLRDSTLLWVLVYLQVNKRVRVVPAPDWMSYCTQIERM